MLISYDHSAVRCLTRPLPGVLPLCHSPYFDLTLVMVGRKQVAGRVVVVLERDVRSGEGRGGENDGE